MRGDAYRQPLGVVVGAGGEESSQRVVARDDETSKVGEQLATEVEDNEEEVESSDTNDGVGLGDAGLLLKVVQGGVLGELWAAVSTWMRTCRVRRVANYLTVERSKVVLRFLLGGRHGGRWETGCRDATSEQRAVRCGRS